MLSHYRTWRDAPLGWTATPPQKQFAPLSSNPQILLPEVGQDPGQRR
jgi:hypothetical protein